jgi:DNA-binding IclR family transcriptional regulator
MSKSNRTVANGEDAASVSGSLTKGLRLVELLIEAPTPQGLSEIAAGAGIDGSTAHRLLQGLVDRGYVVRDEQSRRYTAGPRAFAPLGLTHPLKEMSRDALPILTSLRNSTGQTSGLVLFLGTQRLVVDTVKGDHPLVPYYEPWLRSPLHGSASGKILLASLSKQERVDLIGAGPYQSATPFTVTDPATLETQLEEIERTGYVVARDDAFVGMTAIAAPIKYFGRVVGCLTVVGRSDVIAPADSEAYGVALRNAASLLGSTAPSLRSVFYMFNYRGPVAAA